VWLGLPGNPVSAFSTFALLVRPALERMQGGGGRLPMRTGILGVPVQNKGGRPHWMCMHWGADGRLEPTGVQASHRILSMVMALALVEIPAETVLRAGDPVRWVPLGQER